MASLRRSLRPRERALSLAVAGISTLVCLGVASAAPGPPPVVSGPVGSAPSTPAAPAAPDVVLYDQYDNDGGDGVVSVNRADDPTLTAFAADDFVVPSGQSWSISDIDVREVVPAQNADSFNVFFYTNGTGNLPGTEVAARTNLAYTGNPDLTILLGAAVVLNPGTYWVSVQANEGAGGFWFWKMRSVQSNAGAAFKEAGAYLTGCTAWARRADCTNTASTPDQMFRLLGTTGIPTAVALASFGATRSSSAVAVTWRTAAETQTLGFNVWRALRQPAAPKVWVKLNAKLIRAKGAGLKGASYSYLDRSARRAAAYAYRLDTVNLDGSVLRSRAVAVARS